MKLAFLATLGGSRWLWAAKSLSPSVMVPPEYKGRERLFAETRGYKIVARTHPDVLRKARLTYRKLWRNEHGV